MEAFYLNCIFLNDLLIHLVHGQGVLIMLESLKCRNKTICSNKTICYLLLMNVANLQLAFART